MAMPARAAICALAALARHTAQWGPRTRDSQRQHSGVAAPGREGGAGGERRDMRTTSAPFKYYADWTERIAKGELPHSNLPQPSQLAPRPETFSPTTPLSATLPPPAGRVWAAIHCTPLCYGPLPRDCRGALGAPPAPWARGGRQREALGGSRPGW